MTIVFVSVPGVLSEYQENLFDAWMDRLDILELQIDILARQPETSDPDHLSAVRAAIRRCDAVIVFGFRQLRIDAGVWRLATEEQKPMRSWWSTPWVHIEAGMAIMSEKPTLVLHEQGVAEGIFDQRNWNDCVVGAELTSDTAPEAVGGWLLTTTAPQTMFV